MFIINNNGNELNKILGKDNVININNYIKSYEILNKYNKYLAVKYKMTKRQNDELNKKLKYIRCNGYNILFVMDEFDKLEKDSDKIWEDFNDAFGKSYILEYRCSNAKRIVDENKIENKISSSFDYFSICKDDSCKEENLLYDEVLNNELELIIDYINDYRSYSFDKKLANLKNKKIIKHDMRELICRKKNIGLQYKLLEEYKKCNGDSIESLKLKEVINGCYSMLKKSFNEEVNQDINNNILNIEFSSDLSNKVRNYYFNTIDNMKTSKSNLKSKSKVKIK